MRMRPPQGGEILRSKISSPRAQKEFDMQVVYEDNQIIVVIKPQNQPSQKDESGDLDLLSEVKEYVKQKYNKPGEAFIGLVHRLDRPTGGLMVFARNSKSAERLSKQLQSHQMQKVYFAVVEGKIKYQSQHLVHYLKKDEKNNIVKICPPLEEGAKKAELVYTTLQTNEKYSFLSVKILTGRSHQIRVQLASIGHPIYGDMKYNKNAAKGNLALWAGRLEFTHSTTKEKMVFIASPDEGKRPWNQFNISKYFVR